MGKNTKILVISVNFKKAYPIMKSLHNSKYFVIGAHYRNSPNNFSRYLNKQYRIHNPYHNPEKYIEDVMKIVRIEDVKMIVPVGFIDVVTLSRYKHMFNDIILPLPDHNLILEVSRKDRLIKLSELIGVKYPKTIYYAKRDAEDYGIREKLIDEESIEFPAVIKGISDASRPVYVFSERE